MPWCPKCGYEYRNEITHCPDCGMELVEQSPHMPKVKHPFDLGSFAAILAVFVIAPWALYLLVATFFLRLKRFHLDSAALAIMASFIIVYGAVFTLGRYRRILPHSDMLCAGVVVGSLLQALLCFILIFARTTQEPFKLLFCLLPSFILSGLALVILHLGSLARKR